MEDNRQVSIFCDGLCSFLDLAPQFSTTKLSYARHVFVTAKNLIYFIKPLIDYMSDDGLMIGIGLGYLMDSSLDHVESTTLYSYRNQGFQSSDNKWTRKDFSGKEINIFMPKPGIAGKDSFFQYTAERGELNITVNNIGLVIDGI